MGGWGDPDTRDEVIPMAVDAMIRLDAAFGPHLARMATFAAAGPDTSSASAND